MHIEKDEQVEYYGDKDGTLYIELNYNNRNPNNCSTSVKQELIEQASEIFKKFKSNIFQKKKYSYQRLRNSGLRYKDELSELIVFS